MPSAITQKPRGSRIAKQSSLVGRTRPLSVLPYATSTEHANPQGVRHWAWVARTYVRLQPGPCHLSSTERSNFASSICSVLRTVPLGTRYTKSHEYSGTDPTSTNCTEVL